MSEASMIVGVDVGGTFTDLFVLDEAAGVARIVKVPSTRGEEARGFMNGIERVDTQGRGAGGIATIAGEPAATASTAGTPAATSVNADPNSDQDRDGLVLADEETWNTDPTRPDTDADGLSDGDEVNKYGTNPLVKDTDGDGVSDADEVAAGTDPVVAESAAPAPTEAPAEVEQPVETAPAADSSTSGDVATDASNTPVSIDASRRRSR